MTRASPVSIAVVSTLLPVWVEYIRAFAQIIGGFGIVAAFLAFLVARRQLASARLFWLYDDWRSAKTHRAFSYISDLRRKWKADGRSLQVLAREWVTEHAAESADSRIRQENLKRRHASQLIAKAHAAVIHDYLTPEQLFEVIPELPRYLVVLHPIEHALQEHWNQRERDIMMRWDGNRLTEHCIDDWDRPTPKWEFEGIMAEYDEWFAKPENRTKFNKPDLHRARRKPTRFARLAGSLWSLLRG